MTNEFKIWNILEKVVAIVTDGAANIKLAVRTMNIQHIPCTAHKLNLIVQQSLYLTDVDEGGSGSNDSNDINCILKKCRNIVGFFKRSEVGNRLLTEKQKQLGHTQVLKLKQDICTRWNSTLFMFERLVHLKEPLTVVMISLKDAPSNLTTEEWIIIEDIIPLLKPYNSLTVELSSEEYPTISKIIPLLRGLQMSLNSKVPKTRIGKFIKNNLIANTNKRFEGMEKQTALPYLSKATLLDPRFKKAAFAIENNANDTEKVIISEIVSLMHNTSDTEQVMPTSTCNKDSSETLWNFLTDKVNSVQTQTTTTSSATALMKQYLNMPYQDLN